MRKIKLFTILTLIFLITQANAQDSWQFYKHTNFEKYKADNEKVLSSSSDENRVVFMGNSITEAWPIIRPNFFKNSNYIGRGISGQTTPQMLLRFRKDVIDLHPKVVVLLAGINDIAQNTGFTPIGMMAGNIMSMAELAQHHNIEVVICSVLPALDFPWSPGFQPADKVIELNAMLKKYAEENNLIYVDYHTAMKDRKNGLRVPEFTTADDLVHPNEAGYIVMEKLVQPAIEEALAAAIFSVNPFFTNHMVMQQKEKVAVWGKASAGSQVVVNGSWGEKETTTTDPSGNWQLKINTPKAGGPYQLNITSTNRNIQINDVMIGEVWLASGQSNMSMPLKGWLPNDPIKNSAEEIANAQYPNIRMFKVANKFSLEEEDSFVGKWDECNPKNAVDYSATAYFFARRLHQELNIPIGIIHTSWGGTPAEAWTSKMKIKELGDFEEMIEAIENPEREQLSKEWFDRWEKTNVPKEVEDWNHLELIDQHLARPEYISEGKLTIQLPGRIDLHEGRDIDGVFWFRRTIELEDISSDYSFEMGVADDTDVVYFNGKKIGATSYDFTNSRSYPIPKSLLKKGKNTIAIRLVDTGGPGSISNEIKLTNEKNKDISLIGKWDYIISGEIFQGQIYQYDLKKVNLSERPNILAPSPYVTPSCLYNAMIHPLIPYNIKGAIWYQGESNVGRAEQYQRLFPTMIKDWRTQWKDDFPFYYVQIAPYQYNSKGDPKLDKSQKLRDAQRNTLSLDKTGMVVTLDIGNNKNIHPSNKQDVGRRLAGLALSNDYGKKIISSGPLYKSHTIKQKNIFLTFDFIGSGLMAKNTNLIGFEIAGADRIFVTADAKIIGNRIQVSAKSISKPKFVRYAWRDTSEASLFNKDGLPASSFITE
ncbi:MAG: GDSL-type esterase/lipase family protein [Saprospiraceae bacterium]